MLLPFAFDNAFAALAVQPPFVPSQLFQLGRVLLLQLGVRVGRLIQDPVERLDFALQRLRLPVRRQQQPTALVGIIGQPRDVIHNAHGCNRDRPTSLVVFLEELTHAPITLTAASCP